MAYERGGRNVIQAYLSMKNPYIAKLPPNQFSNPNYEADIISKAKAGKHDGIILKNDTDNDLTAETFYIVFDNKQIKSATDNIGTFAGSNPDIRYSREMDTVKALERQKIADAIIGNPEADFSALRDKAWLIADNILQGATYDINWYPADIKKEFKESPMHKNGCRQESY